MKYYRETVLKGGKKCVLKSPVPCDGEVILHHMIQTSEETENMSRYGDELAITAEEENQQLK